MTCTGFARNLPALNGLLDRLRARPDVADLQVQQERGQNPIQFSFTFRESVLAFQHIFITQADVFHSASGQRDNGTRS